MDSSKTLLKSIPYLSITMNKLGSDGLSYYVLLGCIQLGHTKPVLAEYLD